MSEVILKKQRNWQLMALLVVVVLIASGCVSYDANGQPYGAVYEYLGKPAAAFLDFLAGFLFNRALWNAENQAMAMDWATAWDQI